MIIVAGHLHVSPQDRDLLLEGSLKSIRAARDAEGCLDFTLAADPVDPGRVNVFERWADREKLFAFRGSGPDDDLDELITGYEIDEYEVAGRE